MHPGLHRRTVALAVTLLAACGGPATPRLPTGSQFAATTPAAPDADDDSAGTDTAEDSDAPVIEREDLSTLWTSDRLEASLTTLFVDDVPNGTELLDLFRALALEGDSVCPGEDLAFTTPESSCMSDTGWEYFGFAPYIDEIVIRDDVEVRTVGFPQASFFIKAPDGRTFSAGGAFVHEQLDDASGTWLQTFTGTFVWTGDGYPWIQAGTQVGWDIVGERSSTRHAFVVYGPIAVGSNWAFVNRMDWDNTRCDGVPDVDISIRDDQGRWYDWTAGADCSPCGPVLYTESNGTSHTLGEICLDLSETARTLDSLNDFSVPE